MEGLVDVKPELCEESGPSLFEWALAFVLFIIPFMSFCYSDTSCFILYEIKFAQAILHFNLKEAYDPLITLTTASGVEINSFSVYDLPLNLVFGIWGIPLYLYSVRNGVLEITFPQSFWQVIYGKSILLAGFAVSAFLVYRICLTLGLSGKRSGWGAYIYFTSAVSTSVIGVFGQFDIFAVCLTLAGLLAFIRKEHKKFLLWFFLAVQFKQFAFFMFVPLMLLRDKNIIRAALRLVFLAAFMFLCNLPIMRLSSAFSIRAGFASGIFGELIGGKIPIVGGRASFLVFTFGILCIYCWLHEPKDRSDVQEENRQIVFTALASGIVLFTSFASRPYWFIHLVPYLAIAAVYNIRDTDRILLFEAAGIAAVIVSRAWLSVVPDHAANMLLHNLLGRPQFIGVKAAINGLTSVSRQIKASGVSEGSPAEGRVVFMKLLQSALESVYAACMYAMLWLCRPFRNNDQRKPVKGIRFCSMSRLLLNTALCSFWIISVLIALLRR